MIGPLRSILFVGSNRSFAVTPHPRYCEKPPCCEASWSRATSQGYDLLLCKISFTSNQAVEVAVNLFSLTVFIYTFRHRFLLSLFL